MQSRSRRALALTLAGSVCLAPTALAHEREFTRSRDWHLPFEGERELEFRTFFDTSHGDSSGQIEYEYGVTAHFAIEPGIEIAENEDDEHEIEGAELEFRFNFGDYRRGDWLPALNVEFEYPFEDEEATKLQLQGVLSHYAEHDDFTFNLNFGHELEKDHDNASELTGGWLHRFTPVEGSGTHSAFKLGLEAVADLEEYHVQAGPLLVWRAAAGLNFLASFTPALNHDDDGNFDQLTLIVEWEP